MEIRNTKKNTKNAGFTLVEILFSISILIIIVLLMTLFARNTWVYNDFVSASLEEIDAVRTALKIMTAEIRTAGTAETGAYTISQATSSAFSFYSDIDSDRLKEKVRYFFENGILKKGVIKPTGAPLSYDSANETISTIASSITSSSIFNYYDKNYDGTTSPLSSPVNIPLIRLVKITITIDKNPNRSPTPKTFTTQVSIRNLKDNL